MMRNCKTKIQKTLLIIACIFIAIVFSLLWGTRVYADEMVTVDGIKYNVGTDSVTVTGFDYENTQGDVVIPASINGKPIIKIESYAFSWCNDLTSIELPDGITEIGEYAFDGCFNLKSIKMSDNVVKIGKSAFDYCKSLTSIELPESVREIGEKALYCCGSLERISVAPQNQYFSSDDGGLYDKEKKTLLRFTVNDNAKIPDSVTRIGDGAFSECISLTNIEIPERVTEIGEYAFFGCENLTSIEFPEGITKIEDGTFSCCNKLAYVKLPDSITEIGNGVFGCQSLMGIELPDGVTKIGDGAFYGCNNMERIELPDSLTTIEEGAFDGCDIDKLCIYCSKESYAYTFATEQGFSVHIWENPFVDVKRGKYYRNAVLWAYNSEPQITTGTSSTTFSPSKICNRAQVVTFIWRQAGEPEPTITENPFSDVNESDYFYKAVLWALEHKITTGKTKTTFAPKAECKRKDFVTFLWRAEGKPEPSETTNPFVDVSPGEYYTNAVIWANENSITTGTDATHFSPNKVVNRGQAVTFLFRLQVNIHEK